jgi:hypothetical protein
VEGFRFGVSNPSPIVSSHFHSASYSANVFPDCGRQNINCFASLPIFSEILAGAHPQLPCFYPHSKGATSGPVHVGVRFKAQVHHYGDLAC